MSEIIFEVQEDAADGGFVATALGHGIVTQGDALEELRAMVKDAVNCHFGDGAAGSMPKMIRRPKKRVLSSGAVSKSNRPERPAGVGRLGGHPSRFRWGLAPLIAERIRHQKMPCSGTGRI